LEAENLALVDGEGPGRGSYHLLNTGGLQNGEAPVRIEAAEYVTREKCGSYLLYSVAIMAAFNISG
jgi:hypothetical protein